MKIKVICTHNPQDFFEGNEPEELTITNIYELPDYLDLFHILNCGYGAVVITECRDD